MSSSFIFNDSISSSLCAMLWLVSQSCPTLCDPMDCSLPGSSVHGDSPGENTGVDCHALLQGIFTTQGLNRGLLICRWILYHLSSLVAQRVKCLPAMQETQVRFLGQEDAQEKEMATHAGILAGKIPWMEKLGRFIVHGIAKSRTGLSDFTFFFTFFTI